MCTGFGTQALIPTCYEPRNLPFNQSQEPGVASLRNHRHRRFRPGAPIPRGSDVAPPRFEPANLSRTESSEERLALHKNHEERAQPPPRYHHLERGGCHTHMYKLA